MNERSIEPFIFISYSHDSREHKQWVMDLHDALVASHFHVKIDLNDNDPSKETTRFMEQHIRDAHCVLLICTERYVEKFDKRNGGVGYEALLISDEISRNQNTEKFLPIFRQKNGDRLHPSCIGSRGGFNLWDGNEDLIMERTNLMSWLEKRFHDEDNRLVSLSLECENARDTSPVLVEKRKAALAETDPYPKEDKIDKERLLLSRPRILLDCNLPKEDNLGSLLIRINTLYLHRVQLTLTADQILESLLHGWGTTPDLKQRGFIIGPRGEHPDEWIVQIAGATICLTTEETHQLCEVVDLLAQHYLQTLLHRETANGTTAFTPDGPENVVLLRITRPLWKAMLQFASEHDYDKGSSKWHVFDACGNGNIKTVYRTSDGTIFPYQTYLYPKTPEEYGPLSDHLDEVCVCWNARLSQINLDKTCSHVAWNAQDAYRWLTEAFIPEVISKKESCLTRLLKSLPGNKPPKYFKETRGVDLNVVEKIQDWTALTSFVELAQSHYNSHPHGPVRKSTIESALSVLELLASALQIGAHDLGYIANKLGASQTSSLSDCVAVAQSEHNKQPFYDGYDLDVILRCVWTILKGNAPAKGKESSLLARIADAIVPLADDFRLDFIRCRTLERIKTTSI